MRLLTLQGAFEGGVTCSDHFEEWPSSLKPALTGVSAISLLVQEEYGRIKIFAADGHGHVMFAEVSVPGMPPPPSPRVWRRRPHEMAGHAAIRELEDRVEVIPG